VGLRVEIGMSLNAFTLAIDRFIDSDIPEEVEKLQRVIATAALQKLVLKTPVDTGRARGAWMVTVDSRTSEAPGEVEGVKAGSRGRKGRSAASGSSAISAGVGVIAGAPAFSSIVIQNNVEYIEALEEGGSKQAPAGMLAITIAELEQVFR
jgi:hypothetical protein